MLKPLAVLSAALLITPAWTARSSVNPALAQTGQQEVTVTASFTAEQRVRPDEPIELRLSRPLAPSEGRIAVVVGSTDLTSIFAATETGLKYNPRMLPLSPGETEVVVYLVSPENVWKEIARLPLRVAEETPAPRADENLPARPPQEPADREKQAEDGATPQPDATPQTGSSQTSEEDPPQATDTTQTPPETAQKKTALEKLGLTPSLTLSIKSQPAQSSFPESSRPARPTFTDLNMQGSIRTETARGQLSSQTQFDFVGSSFQQEALRFGELGERAPQIDLASYLMQFQTGKVKYQAGHFSFGTLRHLMNSFSSRGVTLSFPVSSRFDFAASLMNGSSVVGFGNFFGLDKRRHQLLSGTLGYELLPKRPGGLRVEVGALEGWLLPVSGFAQGNVNDAERSRGVGVRALATDPSGRLKLDGGFTRSRFEAPSDPLLEQGATVVAVPAITRSARYLDASYELLKDFSFLKSFFKEKRTNLTVALRHERVDPLFRSLGASTQADKQQNDISVGGQIGEINAQLTHQRANDNLANVPSILKSLTRRSALVLGAPLSSFFGDPGKPSPFLPRVGYSFDLTHQFGAAIPVNGGFELDLSSIPDQVSTNHSFNADWQFSKVRVGYRFNQSFQDNRQTGQELADARTLVNGVTLGLTPRSTLDVNLDINADSAHNVAAGTTDRTLRFTPSVNWRVGSKAVATSNFSVTLAGDAADARDNTNVEFDVQLTYQFGVERDRLRKVQSQLFIRYANRFARARDNISGVTDLTKSQTLNAGLSFTFF